MIPADVIRHKPMRPSARTVAAHVGVWASYGVVHYLARLPAITVMERPAIALASAVLAFSGLVVSALVALAIRTTARMSSREWGVGTIAGLAGAFAWMFADRALLVTIASFRGVTIPWERYPRGVDLEYLFVMLAWTAALLAWRAGERQRALAEQLLAQRVIAHEARLAAIGARLQPHFLFNALNTARSLAAEDTGGTRELLSRIADFLRHALDVDADAPVTLRDEANAARTYLAIEKARFEDALRIEIEVDGGVEELLVPAFILQPLVENAIRHADADGSGVRWVRIRASRDGEALSIGVSNPGRIGSAARPGSGLSIARARLEQLYGDGQRIDLVERDGVVSVTLHIDSPMRREAGE